MFAIFKVIFRIGFCLRVGKQISFPIKYQSSNLDFLFENQSNWELCTRNSKPESKRRKRQWILQWLCSWVFQLRDRPYFPREWAKDSFEKREFQVYVEVRRWTSGNAKVRRGHRGPRLSKESLGIVVPPAKVKANIDFNLILAII